MGVIEEGSGFWPEAAWAFQHGGGAATWPADGMGPSCRWASVRSAEWDALDRHLQAAVQERRCSDRHMYTHGCALLQRRQQRQVQQWQ